jgi:hypothetical protein
MAFPRRLTNSRYLANDSGSKGCPRSLARLATICRLFVGDACTGKTGQREDLDVTEAGLATPAGEIAAGEVEGVTAIDGICLLILPVTAPLTGSIHGSLAKANAAPPKC